MRDKQGDIAGAITDFEQYLALGEERLDEEYQQWAKQRIRALRAQLGDK